MTKLFSNFWSINLGHVGTLALLVFGIGVAWRSVSAQQDQDRASALAREEAITASVSAAVSERNLKIAAVSDRVFVVTERIAKAEDSLKALSSMDREIGTLGAQIKSLNEELSRFREELRSYQNERRVRP